MDFLRENAFLIIFPGIGLLVLFHYLRMLLSGEDLIISFGKRRQKMEINLSENHDRPQAVAIMIVYMIFIAAFFGFFTYIMAF